jgi:hypothetical protein
LGSAKAGQSCCWSARRLIARVHLWQEIAHLRARQFLHLAQGGVGGGNVRVGGKAALDQR